jgi:hypothetical protein
VRAAVCRKYGPPEVDAAAALRHVADGKAIGKVVLNVSRTAGR